LHAGTLVSDAADFGAVVAGEERADDELTGADGGDVVADLVDDADVFVTHRRGPDRWIGLMPR